MFLALYSFCISIAFDNFISTILSIRFRNYTFHGERIKKIVEHLIHQWSLAVFYGEQLLSNFRRQSFLIDQKDILVC